MNSSAHLYLRIAQSDIGMFRFLLEGWDNLAIATTIDLNAAILKLRFARESRIEVEKMLIDLARTLSFTILHIPFQ